ncbi:MinD/ParA family protein [Leptolyngbya sp. FACHB-261]|uniref:MinD/ParA family ATP-binding protein n=1 Tax=Leptolyngbya sp. FACHB-261 TaxID=2692806 RepID=UPI0016870ACB|nr:MinD/ParA family protein [Leptolyngbya sp. FACHB-261]MBD2104016.1 MinD/ParA family protein [Leptolyngbya sp. FACHB-261]
MSKIVSIHSFRGGTGKSNTTANLATTIASFGYRVGIIDTDIQSPGIHVLFGLDEKRVNLTLNDYLWGRCAIQDSAYDVTPTQVKNAKGSVFLIPSSIKVGEIARVLREGYNVRLLNDGFRNLIRALKLDYLFIDTHPGINEETLLSITVSNALVIILRPDRQDFQGTAVTVELARKLKVPKVLLVVNRALQSLDFASVRRQVETAYNIPVAGILPNCDEMMHLASSDLFCLRYPNHLLTQEIGKVANQLREEDRKLQEASVFSKFKWPGR